MGYNGNTMIKFLVLILFSSLAFGAELTVTCDAPTEREDGASLSASEIRGYEFQLDEVVVEVPDCLWIVEVETGTYTLDVWTIDIDGLYSESAGPIEVKVKSRSKPPKNVKPKRRNKP